MTPETKSILRAAASWYDREYERLVSRRRTRGPGNESRENAQVDGRLDVLAQSAAMLRQWARNGRIV